jgi:hypothetical protein
MASIIWQRDSQEAIDNPYQYPAEEQFVREAKNLISNLEEKILNKKDFFLFDRSLEKATWMLQIDILFAFKDSIDVMGLKKHRLVGPLIRIIYENLHQVEYLNNGTEKTKKELQDWFNDKSPRHFNNRQYIKETKSSELSDFLKRQYEAYSKLTHRTYKSLLYNYARGGGKNIENSPIEIDYQIWYDEGWPLRQSISMFYAILGLFGKLMVSNFKTYGILTKEEVDEAWNTSMEKKPIPFGYITPEARKLFGLPEEEET